LLDKYGNKIVDDLPEVSQFRFCFLLKFGSMWRQDLRRPKCKAASVMTLDEEDSALESAAGEKVGMLPKKC
jgi:hypothetical protein